MWVSVILAVTNRSSLPIPFDVLLGVAEQERATGARCTGAVVRVRV